MSGRAMVAEDRAQQPPASALPNVEHAGVPEAIGFFAAMGCLVALEIWWMHASAALTRPLWLDEIHTLLLAERQDVVGSFRSLAAGADFNPPAVYLMYRVVGLLTGGLTDTSMRVVALGTVLAAMTIVYRLLRERFGRTSSGIGAMAVWAQPVVTTAAFDARFYGPLLFGGAALIWVVRRVSVGERRYAAWWLACVSVFVCTVHYFGVLSWLATMVTAVTRAERPRLVAVRLRPALAGPVALALCIPLYLGQRAALSAATWIPRVSLGDAAFLLVALLLPVCLIAALATWAASSLVRRLLSLAPPGPQEPIAMGPAGALLVSQAAVPIVLIALSLVVQPFTQQRYAIVASLAIAPIAAVAAARSLFPLRMAIAVMMVVLSVGLVGDAGRDGRAFDARVRKDVEYADRAVADDVPLVVRRRHTLYPLLRGAPQASRVAVLFDAPSAARDSQLIAVDRDVARIHRRLYGFPTLATVDELRATPTFYYLNYDSTAVAPNVAFPNHAVDRIDGRLYRLRLK